MTRYWIYYPKMKLMMNIQNNGIEITDPKFPDDATLSNDTRKSFVLKGEHKRKWTAENPKNHIGIRLEIDGKLIKSKKINKCDGGLLVDDNRLYLVEFKGQNYEKAAEQLIKTKEYFKLNYKNYNFIFHARIIGKSFPKASTDKQNAMLKLKSHFSTFLPFETEGTENI